MSIRSSTVGGLALVGCLSVCMSLFLFFSTPAYAYFCSATKNCAKGYPVTCSCPFDGACIETTSGVICACEDRPVVRYNCSKFGDIEE